MIFTDAECIFFSHCFCIHRMNEWTEKKRWPFEMHSLQAANIAHKSNNNNGRYNSNNSEKIEFIEIGIINIGSSAQNIQYVIYSLPYQLTSTVWEQHTQRERAKKHQRTASTFYLHVSMWTWCAFTIRDLFRKFNLKSDFLLLCKLHQ